MSLPPNKQLGAYQVQEQIGKGGIATVYKAFHPATNRHVAIKVLSFDLADDPTFNQRFDREAKVVANLQHIHILPVFDYGHQESTPYLVMPLITGGTLSELLRRSRLSVQEVARLFRQMASALDYAHQQGLLHRDIKPSNVLMDNSNNALLADFGLTRMMGSEQPSKLTQSTIIGTPAYMSPEQGQGQVLDNRSDLYSMGVMLYEMLAGDVPYRAETPVAVIFKHVTDPLPSVLDKRPDLPPAIQPVLQKAMAKSAADRYGSAQELADAFEIAVGLKTHVGIKTTPLPAPEEDIHTFVASSKEFPTTRPDSMTDVTQPIQASSIANPPRSASGSSNRLWSALVVGGLAGLAVVALLFLMRDQDQTETDDKPSGPAHQILEIAAHPEGALAVTFSPDGSLILSGGADNTATLWNASTGALHSKLEGHSGDVLSVAYRPDGGEIMTGGQDTMQYLWNVETGGVNITNFAGSPVTAVLYSPSGNTSVYLANQEAVLSSQPANQFLTILRNPEGVTFRSVAFRPQERFLVTGDATGHIIIWSIQRSKSQKEFQWGESAITAIAINDERLLSAYGNEAGQVALFDGDNDTPRTLAPQQGPIHDLAFSPNYRLLAAAVGDGTIPIWDVNNDNLLVLTLTGHEGAVTSLEFSPDGSTLVSAGMDGTLRVWEVPQ